MAKVIKKEKKGGSSIIAPPAAQFERLSTKSLYLLTLKEETLGTLIWNGKDFIQSVEKPQSTNFSTMIVAFTKEALLNEYPKTGNWMVKNGYSGKLNIFELPKEVNKFLIPFKKIQLLKNYIP